MSVPGAKAVAVAVGLHMRGAVAARLTTAPLRAYGSPAGARATFKNEDEAKADQQTTATGGTSPMRTIATITATLLCASALAQSTTVVPLFMSASNAQQQGFVRVINHSDSAGTVRIRAVDDTGYEPSALTLSLAAGAVVHFNSDDLEDGNSGKGLSGSTGAGSGDWRLVLETDLDIEALAYVRTSNGFLTSIHGMALTAGTTHYIPTFNPGSNRNQQSALRLVNRQSEPADVTIHGFDDRNQQSDAVSLTVPARNAVKLTAAELEAGPRIASAEGALGDGSGKWRLFVVADRPIHAMSLLEDPNGYLTNLSASRKTTGELVAIVDRLDFEDGGGGDGDDHGDGRVDATTMAANGSQSGRIDEAGDVDWFRVGATESGTLTAYTTGSLDTVGRLYDSAGSQLTSNDDGGQGRNFRIEREVNAGTYFVSVEAWDENAIGSYTLRTEFESDDGDGGGEDAGEVNFVALSYRSLLTSNDGMRWRVEDAPRLGSSGRLLGYASYTSYGAIAYGDGLWVVVNHGTIDVSEDGRSWSRVVDVPDAGDTVYEFLSGVAFGDGRWTATGSDAILTSTDGRNWSAAATGEDWDGFPGNDVAYGSGLWVGVGNNGIYESSDGLEWRKLEVGTGCAGVATTLTAVAYGDGHWHATGLGGTVCTRRADGRWTRFRTSPSIDRDIGFGGGDFVAVGNTGIAAWEGGSESLYSYRLDDGGAGLVAYRRGTWVVARGRRDVLFYKRGDPKQQAGWIEVDVGPAKVLAAKP